MINWTPMKQRYFARMLWRAAMISRRLGYQEGARTLAKAADRVARGD